jgi:hypothetical protein
MRAINLADLRRRGNFARPAKNGRAGGSIPDYTPARANLAILERVERGEIKGPARLTGFAHGP